MLVLSGFLTVFVTVKDKTTATVERWLKVFGRVMGNFTYLVGTGGWVGERGVEVEPSGQITVWQPDQATVRKIVRLTKAMQAIEQQEAVFLVYQAPAMPFAAPVTPAQALVVYDIDWPIASDILSKAFDPEGREAAEFERLVEYFERKALVDAGDPNATK